jgi:hypothetical protein
MFCVPIDVNSCKWPLFRYLKERDMSFVALGKLSDSRMVEVEVDYQHRVLATSLNFLRSLREFYVDIRHYHFYVINVCPLPLETI